MTDCQACTLRPVNGASLCAPCVKTLRHALANVAIYWCDLDTLHTRQVRLGDGNGGRSGEDRLPIDLRFVHGRGDRIQAETKNAVSTWTRYVLEHVPEVTGPVCSTCLHLSCAAIRKTRAPRDNVPACCEFLARWLDWFRVSDVGGEVYKDILAVEKQLVGLVNRPADRWFAGICSAPTDEGECQVELYATPGRSTIACRGCETVHDVAQRRAHLLAAAEEYELTVPELARAITTLADDYDGTPGTLAKRIHKWGDRNRITPVRHDLVDGRKRPLYRIRDVLDLLAEDARHAVARSA